MNAASQGGCAIPRAQWPRLLAALPAKDIKRCADELARGWQVTDVSLPQSGLGLLQLRDSALAENYFLGEIPVARAHVRLVRPDSQSIEGAAQLMDDRASLVRAIAIMDAVKAAQWPGSERVDELLQAGQSHWQGIEASRKALLAITRVEFSLLGANDEEDNDAA